MKTQFKKLSSMLTALLLLVGLSGFGQLVVTPNITPACHSSDGAVTFSFTGGSGGNYSYILYDRTSYPNVTYPTQTSPTFTNLPPDIYAAYIYSNNSADSSYIVFTIPSTVNVTSVITNTPCPANTGSIVTTTTGGTGGYTYLWSNGATTANLNNLAGGVYRLTVTDGNGCFSTQMDTVIATTSMTVSATQGGPVCNPALTATVTGGVGALHYSWSNGATTATATNFPANQWASVTVTDANGCTTIGSRYVQVTSLAIDSANITATYPTCTSNIGTITVNMTVGTAPYTYAWNTGATTNPLVNVPVGSYTATVTDANGCSAALYYNLYYASQVQVYVGAGNPTCGQTDGSAVAEAFETNGQQGTYSYIWNTGATTATINNLAAGTYSVTTTDNNGCSATASSMLHGIAQFQTSITTTPTACDSTLHTGSATAIVTGNGNPPYSFVWSEWDWWGNTPTIIGYSQTVSNLPVNAHLTVAVTDANGCTPQYNYNDSASIQYDPACFDHITGNIFADLNGNCTFDAGEVGIAAAYIIATSNNGQYYITPDTSGFYDIEVLPGTYTVTCYLYNNGGCATANTCTSSYTHTFTVIGQISANNNFGVNGTNPAFDLGVHMGYEGSAPGQQRRYWIYYYNWGLLPVASGTLTFVHDPAITLVNTTPPYTSYDATTHTITWNLTNLAPMQGLDEAHRVKMYFNIPDTLSLGAELTASATISPVLNDCDPADNTQTLVDVVTGSHDPNEKEVSPAGNLTAADTVLTYTIRFQNTGNGPATLVVISDTLSPNVQPTSVQPGASSSPYTYKMTGNGILTFTFEPIYLTPASQSVDSSQGFVTYTVHTKPNLALGTEIKNTAYIYFDANQAVVTNTTDNHRSDFPTAIKNITGSAITSQVLPNPSSDKARIDFEGTTGAIELKITDALGNVIISNTTETTYYTLNAEKLSAGIYFYAAKDAAGNRTSGKISIVH